MNLKEITLFIHNNFDKKIYYNSTKETFIFEEDLPLQGEDEVYPLFYNSFSMTKLDIKSFVNDNPPLFIKKKDFRSYKTFKAYLEESEIEGMWLDYYSSCLATRYFIWSTYADIKDEEADEEVYKAIRKELEIYEDARYNEIFSSNDFIGLENNGETVGVVNLGYFDNKVQGVSFYIGPGAESKFKMMSGKYDNTQNVQLTLNSLTQLVSFYFDDLAGPSPFRDSINIYVKPYGDDERFSSIVVNRGRQYHNYLPSAVASIALSTLRKLNKALPDLINSGEVRYHDVEDENIFYIVSSKDQYAIYNASMLDYEDNDYEDFYHIMQGVEVEKGLKAEGEYEFSFMKTPTYINDDYDDRIIHFFYVAMFLDHKTGDIFSIRSSEWETFNQVEKIINSFSINYDKDTVPKKIYVTNEFDELILETLFVNYVEKNKTKIVISKKPLKISEVMDELLEMSLEIPDDDKNLA